MSGSVQWPGTEVPQWPGQEVTQPIQGKGELGYAPAPPEPPPQAAQADPGILENARSAIQGADMAALRYLNPGPDDNALMSGLKTAGMVGVHGLSLMAQAPVNALIGAGQGTKLAGAFNPDTGRFDPTISPEQQTAVGFMTGNGMRVGPSGRIPEPTPVPPAPVAMNDLLTAVREAPAVQPPGTWRALTADESFDPSRAYRADQSTLQRQVFEPTPAGGNVPPTPEPTPRPTPPPPPPLVFQPRAPVTAASSPEDIMAAAKQTAQQHYSVTDAQGQSSGFTPAGVNKMVDAADKADVQGPGAKAVAGNDAVAQMRDRLQGLRDQPLTLSDVQAMDEELTGKITMAVRAGDNKVANKLGDIQDAWRSQVDSALPDDIEGGAAGFQALQPARQAWSQYRKMSDVAAMKERADMTSNPTTAYGTAVKNFVTGPKSRGWTDAEKDALKASADRGGTGTVLHYLGSRLLPHVVGVAGGVAGGGFPGFLVGEAAGYAGAAAARAAGNRLQSGRVGRLMGTLNDSVPPPPGAVQPPNVTMLPTLPMNSLLLNAPRLMLTNRPAQNHDDAAVRP